MGCDIHLFVEFKKKGTQKWGSAPLGEFSDRNYNIFARLAGVRNYCGVENLPVRGLPDNIGRRAKDAFFKPVIPDNKEESEIYFCQSEVDEWVANGDSYLITEDDETLCSDPDAHTPSWCTTAEMIECIKDVCDESDIHWQGLVGCMGGYEASGEFDCRAVFWFDN